jgi:hypothetical protein
MTYAVVFEDSVHRVKATLEVEADHEARAVEKARPILAQVIDGHPFVWKLNGVGQVKGEVKK